MGSPMRNPTILREHIRRLRGLVAVLASDLDYDHPLVAKRLREIVAASIVTLPDLADYE